MVNLMTLLTVFTIALEAEARDYGFISDTRCLTERCSVNHNALGQLANQSTLSFLEGRAL